MVFPPSCYSSNETLTISGIEVVPSKTYSAALMRRVFMPSRIAVSRICSVEPRVEINVFQLRGDVHDLVDTDPPEVARIAAEAAAAGLIDGAFVFRRHAEQKLFLLGGRTGPPAGRAEPPGRAAAR